MKVYVLRLGHRLQRDHRISTHCGLVARAFGGDGIIYAGDFDKNMIESVRKVSEEWGGPFEIMYEKNWKKVVENFKQKGFSLVHLTMYGMPIQKKIRSLRKCEKILVAIGGEKVPSEIYDMADFNISITQQPHSEVAALAIFLDRIFKGKELDKKFQGAKKRIIPQERGKKVVKE